MEQGARVWLVTRGMYSDERAAGIYPSLDRAKAQFPDASWRQDPSYLGLPPTWSADDVIVGRWPEGKPIIDAVTIYEMTFDQDIEGTAR